jgi:hypothetical protein
MIPLIQASGGIVDTRGILSALDSSFDDHPWSLQRQGVFKFLQVHYILGYIATTRRPCNQFVLVQTAGSR